MTLFRHLPFDLMKEIVSFLDFDTCALLICTFDCRIQHFFGLAGAVNILSLGKRKSEFFPAHRHLLKSLSGGYTLKIGSNSSWLLQKRNFDWISRLAPWHLELNLVARPKCNISHLFESLRVLDLKALGTMRISALGTLLSAVPSSLERLFLLLDPSARVRGQFEQLETIWSGLPQLPRLVEVQLDLVAQYWASTVNLHCPFGKFPSLEKMTLTYANLSEEELCKTTFPSSLTYLSIASCDVHSHVVAHSMAHTRNKCGEQSKETEVSSWTNCLPASLTHLEIPTSNCLVSLPRQLQNLKLDARTRRDSLYRVLVHIVPTLFALRSLSIALYNIAHLIQAFKLSGCTTWQWPPWITHFKLSTDEGPEFSVLCSFFDRNQLALLQGLKLEVNRLGMRDLMSYVQAFPKMRITVERAVEMEKTQTFLSRQSVQRCATLLAEQGPLALLVEWSKLLNLNPAIHKVKLCACRACVERIWKPATLPLTSVTIPINTRNFASYGLLQLCGDGPMLADQPLPLWIPQAETLEQITFETTKSLHPRPSKAQAKIHPTRRLSERRSTADENSLLPGLSSRFFKPVHLDFGNALIHPDDTLWDSLPHSVTYLRSTFHPDARVSFGARPTQKHTKPTFSDFSPAFRAYNFVVLDTPYFIFKLDQLQSLCAKHTLTSLKVTIKDLDTEIFTFALLRATSPKPSFPSLQHLTLRAFPIVNGMLSLTHPDLASFQMIAREAALALEKVGVHVVQCLLSPPLCPPPSKSKHRRFRKSRCFSYRRASERKQQR